MAISLTKWIKSLVVTQEGTTTPREIELTPGGSASTKTTITGSQTSNVTVTLPDATTTLAGRDNTETLSNKTLDNTNIANLRDDRLTIQDNGDVSKQLRFEASAIATGTGTTVYTVPSGYRADVKDMLIANTTAGELTIGVYIVPSGGTAGVTNILVDARVVGPHETYECFEAQGQTFQAAGFLQAKSDANAAITINGAIAEVA